MPKLTTVLSSLRDTLMTLIAAVGRARGSTSGGSSPSSYLYSLAMTGPTTGVATYATVPYTVIAKDQNGIVTSDVPAFASSAHSVATIDSVTGIVTPITAGSTVITASATNSLGQLITSNPIVLIVAARTVTTVTLADGDSSVIATHSTTAFTATAQDQNSGTMAGQTFVFHSGSTTKATINSATGVALGVAAGTSAITATCAGITSNTITLTVDAQVATSPIAVTPSSFSILAGNTRQLAAVVSDQGTPANVIVGASVSWASSSNSQATVNGTGLVTGVSAGSATITATSGSATGTSAATITAPVTPSSISLAPSPITLAPGATQQLAVTDNFGNDVTSQCTFSINTPSVATIDAPTLTSATPSTLAQGASNQDISLVGTNFTATGQSIVFTPGGGITTNSLTFNSSVSSTVNVSLSASATTGAGTIKVQDTSHGTSNTRTFTVTGTTPSIPFTLGVIVNLKADAGTSTTSNGAALTSWTDQGSAGTVYSQSTAGFKPTYQSNVQNGLPVIRFDGVDDYLVASGIVTALNVARVAIFTVAKRNGGSSDGLVLSNNDPNNNAGYGVGFNTFASLYYGTGSTSAILRDTTSLTGFEQCTYILDPNATNKQELRRNGVSVATSASTSTVQSSVVPTIGALSSPIAYFASCDAGEVVIVSLSVNNLTLTQIQSMESYLKSKWGTP